MPSIVALIPARSGSKGVVHKNIRLLGGHQLLEWSIRACQLTPSIDRIIVSTDSEQYAKNAREMGADVPFLRPAQISTDRSTDYDFVRHALDWLSKNGGEPDYIAHIRPTTPLRVPSLIDEAIDLFIQNRRATALRSVHSMAESAYKTFEIAEAGQLKQVGASSTNLDAANGARQGFPKTYIANGYVDVLSTQFIRKASLIHGDYVLPFITPSVTEVDTDDDFKLLEYEIMKNPEILNKIFG